MALIGFSDSQGGLGVEKPLPGRGMPLTMKKADHSLAGFVVLFRRRTAVKFAASLLSDRNSHGKFASSTQGTVLLLMLQIPASAFAVAACNWPWPWL